MCVWWVQDWVPDHGKEKATVMVHVQDGFPALDGFHSPPLPKPFGLSLDCGTIPADAVDELQCRSWVSSSHCLSVLTQSDFQCPLLFHPHTYTSEQSLQGLRTQLLSAYAVVSCSSLALGLSWESSLVWRQASLPEGHRPSQSSCLDPWCVWPLI